MNCKAVWASIGIVSLATILSGCGTASTVTNHNDSAPEQRVSSQEHSRTKTDSSKWPTVHIQDVGQLPVAMVGASLTHDNGEIVVVGGYTGSVSLRGIYRVTPTVQQIATLPQRTHDAASGYIGSTLYVFGGGQATSYNSIVSIRNRTVTNAGKLSEPLSDAVGVPWAAKGTQGLLMIGGYNGQTYRKEADYFYSVYKHLVFTPLFKMPVGLRYTAAIAAGHTVYLVGGQTPTYLSSAVYSWNPHWGVHVVGHLPEPLQKAAVFYDRGFLIVVGGLSTHGHISSDIYAIRLKDGAIKRIGKLSLPLADMGYTQVGSNGYVVGGDTGAGYSSKVLKFVLS